jgi:YVTN family beta-propeller protein
MESTMKKLMILLISITLLSLTLFSCKEDSPTEPIPEPTAKAIYVLNSAATSISVINLENNTVTNNVATVGTWPNQILYHGGKLYCVNSGSNNIMVFNTTNFQAETPIPLGSGHNPMNMAIYNDNTAYVACSVSEKVLKVNLTSKTVTDTIDAGVGATGIIVHNNKVYVANTAFDGNTYTYGQGTVTVIDATTDNVTKTIDVGMNPQDIALAPDGRLHVVCTGDYFSVFGKVFIINPSTDTVADSVLIDGSPGSIRISDVDKRGYLGVWGAGLLVYNTETKAIIHGTDNYFLGKGGSGLFVDPDGNVFVSVWDDDQVIKLDKNNTVLNTFTVGDSPLSLTAKIE